MLCICLCGRRQGAASIRDGCMYVRLTAYVAGYSFDLVWIVLVELVQPHFEEQTQDDDLTVRTCGENSEIWLQCSGSVIFPRYTIIM